MSRRLLLLALASCGGSVDPGGAEGPLPDVLLVTLDTLRADHLGAYGYPRATSPRLDGLAAEGVLFERCLAPMATTLPSHTSMFTGVGPIEHGVLANLDGRFVFERDASLGTLAEVLSGAGYDTGAFVSTFVLRAAAGLEVGFDTYEGTRFGQRPGNETVDLALAWLEGQGGASPWFLWVHLFDPHTPYEPPEELRGTFRGDGLVDTWLEERGVEVDGPARLDIDLYDAEVLFTDRQVGRLLDAAGPDAVVLVTADHGEGLHQHGIAQHGYVWGEQLQVPLILRAPGLTPGRDAGLCSLMDVPPTLLGIVQPPGAGAFLDQQRGRDLLAASGEPRPLLGQSTARKRVDDGRVETSWTTERWKLLRRGASRKQVDQVLLYDLEADPHEQRDVAGEHPEVLANLQEALDEHLRTERGRRGGRRREATGEEQGTLESLGYGGGDEDE